MPGIKAVDGKIPSSQGLYEVSTTQNAALGHRVEFEDGRVFRYVSTIADLSKGDLLVNWYNAAIGVECEIAATYFGATTALAPIATEGGAIGDTTVRCCILSGSRVVTANLFRDGFLYIRDGAGEGDMYMVRSNEANAATGSWLIKLHRGTSHGLITALTATSVGLLQINQYKNVALHTAANYDGDQNQIAVGRAMVASTASTDGTTEYLFMQTKGRALM